MVIRARPRLRMSGVGRDANAPATSFFTDFSGSENPLSEGGAWNGQPIPAIFTNPVFKSGGLAWGAGSGTNDAYAVLNPSALLATRRTRITTTVSVTGAIGNGEVEHHHRSTYSAVSGSEFAKLMEVDFLEGGIVGVRWNGDQSDVHLCTATINNGYVNSIPPQTGDLLVSECTDDGTDLTITVYQIVSGVTHLIYQFQDDSGLPIYTTGQFGMGFDGGDGSFTFSDYLAENF